MRFRIVTAAESVDEVPGRVLEVCDALEALFRGESRALWDVDPGAKLTALVLAAPDEYRAWVSPIRPERWHWGAFAKSVPDELVATLVHQHPELKRLRTALRRAVRELRNRGQPVTGARELLANLLRSPWPVVIRRNRKRRLRSSIAGLIPVAQPDGRDHYLVQAVAPDGEWVRALRDAASRGPAPQPAWDERARTLRFGGRVLRTYSPKKPAPNQWAVLGELQRAGWPATPVPTTVQLGQLREALKSLNRAVSPTDRQRMGLRFSSYGTGKHVTWQVIELTPDNHNCHPLTLSQVV